MTLIPPIVKGYTCPGTSCDKCPFVKTLCVVYGKDGIKLRKEWEKKNDRLAEDTH